jgi:hypothetical protein
MSLESDLIQHPSTESSDALRPELFFAPPPQHTDAPPPELFDQEVAVLDLDLPFEQFEDFFTTFHNSIPAVDSTPSALTYSTDSVHEVTSSQYSSDFTQSDYPIPSEIESYFSLNNGNGLYGTAHDSIHSADFSNGPPSIPPLHPAEPKFDFGTSDLSPNFVGSPPEIPPEDLFTVMQPRPTSVVPTPLPVHVTPDSEAQIAPAPDRPYKCPLCPRCKAETI